MQYLLILCLLLYFQFCTVVHVFKVRCSTNHPQFMKYEANFLFYFLDFILSVSVFQSLSGTSVHVCCELAQNQPNF